MMRATMRLLIRVAVVGVLIASGCTSGGGPQSAAHPNGPPAGNPPASRQSAGAGTPAPGGGQAGGGTPQTDRCHTSGLALLSVGPSNGAAGNIYQELGLRNNSPNACWVYGFVGAAILDPGGKPLPTNVLRDTGGRWFPFAHVGTYTVAPGATAPFWMHWSDVPVGSLPACTTGTGLLVTPPDETTQLRMNLSVMACNSGELDVSPVTAPGTTGP
jgi:hypothetical protein